MIGWLLTGQIDGVQMDSTSDFGLAIRVGCRLGNLAVIDEGDKVAVAGDHVGWEVALMARRGYRRFTRGFAHQMIYSHDLRAGVRDPHLLDADAVLPGALVEGVQLAWKVIDELTITIDDRPGRLAVITDEGKIVASGPSVAREAEAVALNA